MSTPFREAGWQVVEVDWDPRYKPTHCCDLMTWDCPYEPGFFDCIWCSPDCTQYSIARTTAKTPRDLVKADALVQRCLDLIRQLKPNVWWIENPDSGYLKSRPCVQGLSGQELTIVCMEHHTASARGCGPIARSRDLSCVTAHTASQAGTSQQHREGAEETRTARRSHGMNCIVYHRQCVRRSTQSATLVAHFQRL